MTKEKRQAIEDRYIFRDYDVDPKNKSDSLKKARHYEFNKYQDTIHLFQFMGPKSKNSFKVCPCGFGNINADLAVAIYYRQKDLDEARKEARDSLNKYLKFKKEVKDHSLDWNDEGVRTWHALYKKDWIESSNNVKLCKRSLWHANLMYARFLEWYNATSEYIKDLESKIKEN